MERMISSLIASLCMAPLFYFVTAWFLIVFNQEANGPDSRLGVAYLSTYGGFAAAIGGFFLVWFLSQTLLTPNHLRAVQIFDVVALVGWGIIYLYYADQQPKRLEYSALRPVLDIELRATKAMLNERPIDAVFNLSYCGGSDLTSSLPDPVREEGEAVILSWQTTPFEVKKWEVCAFLEDQPILFLLDLPQQPTKSTDWSGWTKPVQGQDTPVPQEVLDNLTLRYRFQLVPYGQ